ncbi:hypothetical protein, partial [Ameyamaea chiangmaiensis]
MTVAQRLKDRFTARLRSPLRHPSYGADRTTARHAAITPGRDQTGDARALASRFPALSVRAARIAALVAAGTHG